MLSSMLRLKEQGHDVELVEYRELVDPDSTFFHQFIFAVDGKRCSPWEVPKYHRARFKSDEEFERYLARTAVSFSQSEHNLEARR